MELNDNRYVLPEKDHWYWKTSYEKKSEKYPFLNIEISDNPSAEEITTFIKAHCNGYDEWRMPGNKVLCWAPTIQMKSKGGIYLRDLSDTQKLPGVKYMKILDWGPDSWKMKDYTPSNHSFRRGQWVRVHEYQFSPLEMPKDCTDFALYEAYFMKVSDTKCSPALIEKLLDEGSLV